MKAVVSWFALALSVSPGVASAADRAPSGSARDDVPVVATVSGSAVASSAKPRREARRASAEKPRAARRAPRREPQDDEHKKTARMEARERAPEPGDPPRLARVSHVVRPSTAAPRRGAKVDGAAARAAAGHHEPTVLVPASVVAQPVRIERTRAAASPAQPTRLEPRGGKDVVVGVDDKRASSRPAERSERSERSERNERRGGPAKADDKRSLLRAVSTREEPALPGAAAPGGKDAAREGKDAKEARTAKEKACLASPVEVVRGAEVDRFALTRCDGQAAPLAVERLSTMLRAGSEPRAKIAKEGDELGKGARRVDPRLVDRLQTIVTHFVKPGAPARVAVVSGFRPGNLASQHGHARAMDIRLEGVANEDVVQFCKTLVDTGCGYYPNSSFVHVDVRPQGTGHVHWIDASGPGEAPRYVSAWPPPKDKDEPTTSTGESLAPGETHGAAAAPEDGEGAGE